MEDSNTRGRNTLRFRPLLWLFGGIAALLLLVILLTSFGGAGARIGLGLATFVTAALIGALLGFLFSMPRVLARPGNATPDGAGTADNKLLQTNTNLERVSDWLTTILLGVALADLSDVNDGLLRLRRTMAEAARGCADAGCGTLPLLAPFLVLAGAAFGFLGMYLLTRLSIAELFRDAEQSLEGSAKRAVIGMAQLSAQMVDDAPSSALLAETLKPGPVTVDDALDVMLAQLYQTFTNGYQRAIDLAASVGDTPLAKRADYWFYLAAAWGQKHAAIGAQGSDADRLSARDNAVDAAARAIAIDPGYKARLAVLTYPDGGDDDLASLREDAGLRQLLGL